MMTRYRRPPLRLRAGRAWFQRFIMDIMAEAKHEAPLRLDDLLKAIETKVR